MIRYGDTRQAMDWVDRSGVAPELEALLRPTSRGRPRQLTVRALLVGIKLAIDHAKTSCLTDVHDLLVHDLGRNEQLELGIRDRRTGRLVTLPQVRRLFTRVTDLLDPTAARRRDRRRDRAALLQHVLDRLLDATMPAGAHDSGAYAIDGTGVWSWSRGKRRTDQSADPDANWGVKTAKSGKTEAYFGYELHALVRVGKTGDPLQRDPVRRRTHRRRPRLHQLRHRRPAHPHRPRRPTGEPVREIVADRGYTYKTNWGPSLYALGIDPVLDLHATQYGPQGSHDGARIITGVPHCPATPAAFDIIKRPDRLADSPALDQFVTDIDRREQFAFRRVAGPDPTGKERYECPARSGKVRCPLHKPSLQQPLTTPKVSNPPAEPPRCCTQRTITVPGDVDPKSRQRHYWGSRTWITAFSRRSRVEGWFGNIKSHSTEALRRGTFRVMGLAKTSPHARHLRRRHQPPTPPPLATRPRRKHRARSDTAQTSPATDTTPADQTEDHHRRRTESDPTQSTPRLPPHSAPQRLNAARRRAPANARRAADQQPTASTRTARPHDSHAPNNRKWPQHQAPRPFS